MYVCAAARLFFFFLLCDDLKCILSVEESDDLHRKNSSALHSYLFTGLNRDIVLGLLTPCTEREHAASRCSCITSSPNMAERQASLETTPAGDVCLNSSLFTVLYKPNSFANTNIHTDMRAQTGTATNLEFLNFKLELLDVLAYFW